MITLNKRQLKHIVTESVKKVLKEISDDTESCYQEIVDFINDTQCDFDDCVNALCYVIFGEVEELIDGGEYGMDVFYVDWKSEMRQNEELNYLTISANLFVEDLRTKYNMDTIHDAMHKLTNQRN